MRRIPVAAIAFLLASAVLTSRPAKSEEPGTKVDAELANLPQAWLNAEAQNDHATLDRLIADDFMGTGFGPNILSKLDIVPPDGKGGNRFPSSTVNETTAHQYGVMGVVMGRATLSGEGRQIRFTLVCMKRQQAWTMVAAHLSTVVPSQ